MHPPTPPPANITTTTNFLQRLPLYDTVKPYSLRFDPGPDPDGAAFPRSNISLEEHTIHITDIRPTLHQYAFEEAGFCIMDLDLQGAMGYDDFGDEEKIRDVFLKCVAERVRRYLGAGAVQVFEHTVRRRHEIFPVSTGKNYQWNQPTSLAHVDTTVPWIEGMVRYLNPGKADQLLKNRVQCVNVWMPLKGPVRDWPLAMCDPAFLNAQTDLVPCDLVYPDYVVENQQLYYSKKQRWIYLSDQKPGEAWLFLQADSENVEKSVPHASFPNPLSSSEDLPRESIEVRTIVYY